MENWVKIRNYKCFGAEPQGFDEIAQFNIIIGRNNAGKSSLLDLADFLTKPFPLQGNRSGSAEVLRMGRVEDADYKRTFPADTTGSDIGRFSDYGQQFINKVVRWRISHTGYNEFVDLMDAPPLDPRFRSQLVSAKRNPLAGKLFKRLSAERDFQPEFEVDELKLSSSGAGATNIIQHYIHDIDLPSELIEVTLLAALNDVFGPDAQFSRIGVQRIRDKRWEVFLDEEDKGRVVLSNSGSGLKTILLVLLLIFVIPQLEGKALSTFVFALEELENNTHPALQRRLLLFLHQTALREQALFFLTTHSTVAIDFFSRDKQSDFTCHPRPERVTCSTSIRIRAE
ncbi:MAG: AAA family ATPase [Acidobacteria bacterium]|nr:AAA family ATPase [Acidobacteriota bacterium]MBV9067819.1 AAA family ATPase [Acidobacteriota bacterium]MBV9185172.1 AAA family ATPase [Acidobacteriota bacterium]